MNYYFKRPNQLKRYAAFVLAMFVVSVLNMSMQIPAHAAMQSMQQHSMQMSDTSSMMNHMAMPDMHQSDCGCPPGLCESVDAQHNQLGQSSFSVSMLDLLAFYPIFMSVQVDTHHRLADISFHYQDWQYHQHTPPPLSLNTILLI